MQFFIQLNTKYITPKYRLAVNRIEQSVTSCSGNIPSALIKINFGQRLYRTSTAHSPRPMQMNSYCRDHWARFRRSFLAFCWIPFSLGLSTPPVILLHSQLAQHHYPLSQRVSLDFEYRGSLWHLSTEIALRSTLLLPS